MEPIVRFVIILIREGIETISRCAVVMRFRRLPHGDLDG
jgi:hypothetical protein